MANPLPPLPTELNPDGKSLVNPSRPDGKLSEWYEAFRDPISTSNNAYDFHIYYLSNSPKQMEFASRLHEKIRREFPELRVYKFWDKPVGPHPVAMFEVNVFTPIQFGALFGFLTHQRGDLSVLIHTNTKPGPGVSESAESLRDHTERAIWMGKPYPINSEIFTRNM